MQPAPAPPTRSRRRIPKWLKVALGVFAVLIVLGAIFGKKPDTASRPLVAQQAPGTPATTTTPLSTPAPVSYTVDKVLDGANVELSGSDGSRRIVRLLGLVVATGNNCFAPETLSWATSRLVGPAVRITTDSAAGVALTLADGTDYATAALLGGYATYAADAAVTSLQAVEMSARQAKTGLWGAPCNGVIDAPAPQPPAPQPPAPQPPAPQPPAPSQRTSAQPPPAPLTSERQAVEPAPSPSVYYANCAAARAAGAAPLHVGDPGYRKGLDRDGDGIACE